MTQTLSRSLQQPGEPALETRLVYAGRSWEQFKLIQKGFESAPGVRLFYYAGTIEILMPGREHELFGRVIGYLVVTFLVKRGIFFEPTGAMTQEKESEVSAQADESFCMGSAKAIPDLSIEVIFGSGGVEKLARYRALGTREVWFWEDGVLALYHLRSTGYEQVERSQLEELRELDIDLLKRCIAIAETDAGEAMRVFQQGI
jgi:Uma2 family endonuclease